MRQRCGRVRDRQQRHQAHHRANAHRLHPLVFVDEDVVEEAVLLVPEALPVAAEVLDRLGDRQETFHEGGRDVTPVGVDAGQLGRDPQHLQAEEGDPARRVRLLEPPAVRDLLRPVEDRDVVHADEAALEEVVARLVLAVDPPAEVERQLVHDPGQELVVAGPISDVDLPGRPRVHRRVHVREVPFIGRQLAVGVLGPLAAHEQQLVLREGGVDVGKGDGVEGKVPGGEPGVLPVVRHRDDVGEIEVAPVGVAAPGLGSAT